MEEKKYAEIEGKLWMLAKISNNQQRLKSFVAGEVFMNPLSYFIDLEKDSGVKGQGDRLEAAHYLKDVTLNIVNKETGESIPFVEGSELTLRSPERIKTPVYCMVSIDLDVMKVLRETDEFIEFGVFLAEEKLQKIIKEFGEYAVIVPVNKFKERLDNAIKAKGGTSISGKVNYHDYSKNYTDRLSNYGDLESPLVCFNKCDSFKYQNEYRFLMEGVSSKNGVLVNVGDLSDIAHELKTRDLFSGSITIKFNKIFV